MCIRDSVVPELWTERIPRVSTSGKTLESESVDGDPAVKAKAAPAKSLTTTEALLLQVAVKCSELDTKTRKKPSHWDVFLAAWKDGMNDYDMEKRKHWPRRTAGTRLRNVERTLLSGAKISALHFDPAILNSVQAQLKLAHDHHAKKTYLPNLLDNTCAANDDKEDA